MINISKLLWRFKELFLFFISATTIYKIHPPFAFRLVQRILENDSNYYSFDIIESYRNKLLKSKENIQKIEHGEGFTQKGPKPERSIADLAKIDSSTSLKGQILFKLVNELEPKSILEFGTCIGIGTSYLSFANQKSALNSVEACPNTLAIAEQTLQHCNLKNYTLHNKTFDQFIDELKDSKTIFDFIYIDGHHNEQATIKYFNKLKPYMNPSNCTIVFDDIYWSAGMKEAWQKIKKDDTFKLSIDLFHIGIIFRSTNLRSKSTYKLVKSNWKPWINGFFASKSD
jgi:predicted O-methyltransferase YrrM